MSEEKDEHYQPWLRNQGANAPGASAASGAGASHAPGGIARPAPLPTEARGTNPRKASEPRSKASDLSADELLSRPIAIPPTEPSGPGIGEKLTSALSAAAHTAAELTRKADLPRRSRKVADEGAQLAAKGIKQGGKALKAAAAAASEAASRASEAAAPALKAAATASRKTLDKGAKQAQGGLSSGVRKASETARKLAKAAPAITAVAPRKSDKAQPPVSQLEKLLEQEATAATDAADAAARPTPAPASGLPLFATETPATVPDPLPNPAPDARSTPPTSTEKAVEAPVTTQPAPTTKASAAAEPAAPVTSARAATLPVQVASSNDWRRHPGVWAVTAAVLTGLAFIAGAKWGGSAMDKAATEAIVRNYLLENPEVLPEAMDRLQAKQKESAITRLRSRIEKPFSGAWAGAADGDVTLTVFTDYACTFCRASVPDIERLLREDPKLKVVFRELPVIGAESEPAARLALVAAKHGLYMPMHRMLFASGNPDASARASAAARFSLAAPPAELNDPAITVELRSNLDLARELGFNGTPAWVVGNRAMDGAVGYEKLKEAVAAARGG